MKGSWLGGQATELKGGQKRNGAVIRIEGKS